VTLDRIGWHNRGIELRQKGQFGEALKAIEMALMQRPIAPETLSMRAHLLADLGRFDAAVDAYRDALKAGPQQVDTHETFARLLPQIGRGAEALDSYRAALAQSPETGILWVSAMGTAKALGEPAILLEWAQAAEARFGPDTMVTVFAAHALSTAGRDAEARDLLVHAVATAPDYVPAQTTLAHVLVKLGEYRAAEAAAGEAVRSAPEDQAAWALLTVIWRLLDDPQEFWLADYERLVMPIDLTGLDLRALTTVLKARHRTSQHPADQSLRGGSQTRGRLFDDNDLLLTSLQATVKRELEARLAQLPVDATHPFLGRRTRAVQFVGSWSVRLRSQGFHISHMHPEGWLSSALYIDLPPEVGVGDAGALAFGVPDAALRLDLRPRRIVQPKAGQLVLFPSYFWHGTLPFESTMDRLTVAFDALPA
jgi:tetratricopeptide (TPR) repeat protein